jgi:hypothetical protein
MTLGCFNDYDFHAVREPAFLMIRKLIFETIRVDV